jgi:hypothetical protein
MQKQTFERIDRMELRIARIEKMDRWWIRCNTFSCTFWTY